MSDDQKKTDTPADPAANAGKTPAADPPKKDADGDGNKPDPAVAPYRPDGLPDHLYGESEKDIIDKLFKGYKGARDELSKSGKNQVPEKLDDYKIELPDELAKAVLRPDKDGKDPVFEVMRTAAHKHGIPADKAQAWVSDFYKSALELQGGEGDGASDADFEYAQLGGADKAKPIVDGVVAGLNGLMGRGLLDQSDVDELTLSTLHSQGVQALRKLIAATGEKMIPNKSEGGVVGGQVTEETLHKRVADPRYRHGSKEFDQKFFDDTTKMFEEFYSSDNAA